MLDLKYKCGDCIFFLNSVTITGSCFWVQFWSWDIAAYVYVTKPLTEKNLSDKIYLKIAFVIWGKRCNGLKITHRSPRLINCLLLSASGPVALLHLYIDFKPKRNHGVHIVLQLSIMFELTKLPKHVGEELPCDDRLCRRCSHRVEKVSHMGKVKNKICWPSQSSYQLPNGVRRWQRCVWEQWVRTDCTGAQFTQAHNWELCSVDSFSLSLFQNPGRFLHCKVRWQILGTAPKGWELFTYSCTKPTISWCVNQTQFRNQ